MPRIAVANELGWPVRRHYDLGDGIDRYAEEQGDWQLEVGPFPDVRIKRGQYFDGIVGRITPEILEVAQQLGIPVVNVWINSPVIDQVPSVTIDAAAAGELAARHLYERGYTKLVHIGWLERIASNIHYEAFAKTAEELGCEHSRISVSFEFELTSVNWDRFVALLAEEAAGWEAPVGICTWSDDLGRAAITELRQLGWAIPGEIAVISTNNDTTHCNISPGMSSIDLGYHDNGYAAAHLLNQMINGKEPPSDTVLVAPQGPVVRETSDPYSEEASRVSRALRYAMMHCCEQISPNDVASAAGLPLHALDLRFKKAFGRTVEAELRRMRIDKLKHTLRTSQDPIEDLALAVGFSSEAQAAEVFEQLVGKTPAKFREGTAG